MYKDLFQLISFTSGSVDFVSYLSHTHAERQGYRLKQLLAEQGSVVADAIIQRLQSSPLVYRVLHDRIVFPKGLREKHLQNFVAMAEGRDRPWPSADLPIDAPGPRFRHGNVDFHSPWQRLPDARNGLMSLPFQACGDDEQAATLQKLEAAFALIDQVPAVARFVSICVRIIRVRIDESPFWGSEQYPGEIGTIRLHNPLSPCFTTLAMAERIVHEAIHNALCMFEEVIAPLALRYEDERVRRVFSPWTFNPIAQASYLHAVFVYYGIWCFLQALTVPGDSSALSKAQFHNASGFLRGVSVRRYVEGYGQENPFIMKLMDAMQGVVTSHYRERL